MERPAEYVKILFPLCDLSLTPVVHGQEVPFHCLFGLVFVRLCRIWASLPFSCSAPPLNSCLSGRQHDVCAFCNNILLPQDGAFCSGMFYV